MLDIYNLFEYNIHKVNFVFKKRITLLSVSFACLFLGLSIYLFLRRNTYIHTIMNFSIIDSLYIEHPHNNQFLRFIKYYFIDFLWCFSFNLSLVSVSYSFSKKIIIIYSFISFFVGFIFEIMQLIGFVNGTFDCIDIIMYLIASVLGFAINIKIKEK